MKLLTVPAATGLQWVRLGMRTFLKQPLAMAGLFFMFMAVVSVLSMLPFLGAAISALLTPAINLGLMSATREAEAGRFPMPTQLLTAFRGGPERTRGMMTLGGLYGLCLLVVLLVVGLLDSALSPSVDTTTMTQEQAMQIMLSSPALWIGMVLMLPLQVLFWHAPALLFWHGITPVKSLFFSALAAWANKGALALFLCGWLAVFLLLGVLMSVFRMLLGGSEASSAILYPAVLLIVSMFFTSIWFSFRDCFLTDDPLS